MSYLTGSRSQFPNDIDQIKEMYDLSPSQQIQARRWQELKLKQNKTPVEIEEYNTLSIALQDFLFGAEEFNKAFDMVIATQEHYRDNTVGFVEGKQQEMNSFANQKKTEVNTHTNAQLANMTAIQNDFTSHVNTQRDSVYSAMTESVDTMRGRRDSFGNYVDTKEDEIRGMVQDFDSRTTRYYQTWTAMEGQVIYNIFNGEMGELPSEARLMLDADDIDVIIQGVILKPYVDYDIAQNGNYDSIELKGNASGLMSAGTEVSAKWYKNVGKLYFKHSSSHELGASDEIKNIQSEQLHTDLQDKINRGNISITTIQPSAGLWFKVVG